MRLPCTWLSKTTILALLPYCCNEEHPSACPTTSVDAQSLRSHCRLTYNATARHDGLGTRDGIAQCLPSPLCPGGKGPGAQAIVPSLLSALPSPALYALGRLAPKYNGSSCTHCVPVCRLMVLYGAWDWPWRLWGKGTMAWSLQTGDC